MHDGQTWKWKGLGFELVLTKEEYEAMPLFPRGNTLDDVITDIECDLRYRLYSPAHDAPMVCWINYREPGAVKWVAVLIDCGKEQPEPARDRFDPRNWGIR